MKFQTSSEAVFPRMTTCKLFQRSPNIANGCSLLEDTCVENSGSHALTDIMTRQHFIPPSATEKSRPLLPEKLVSKEKIAVFFPKDSEAVFDDTSERTFGGATVQLFNITRKLAETDGLTVYSLINEYEGVSFEDEKRLNFIKTFKLSDVIFVKVYKLARVLRRISPDILIQRGLTMESCLLALYCKLTGIKFVFMYAHDREASGRYQKNNRVCFLYSLLLLCSSRLIVQSRVQRARLGKYAQRKADIVKSGYEISECSGNNLAGKDSILWVGRLDPWKRAEVFIDLAAAFPEQKFIMVGPVVSGLEDYGRSIISKASHYRNIQYVSFVHYHAISKYFDKAKVFVNTSTAEGFPNTFIQAGIAKAPIISLNVDPDGFLEKNDTGFFCGNDFLKMKQYLASLINDDELYRRQSSNIFNYVSENNNIDTTINDLLDAIRR